MHELSQVEVTYILKALVEHKAHLERVEPYPERERDLQPYEALIKKLTTSRTRVARNLRGAREGKL